MWKVWIATRPVAEPEATGDQTAGSSATQPAKQAMSGDSQDREARTEEENPDADVYNRPLSDPPSAVLQAWRLPRIFWLAVLWAGFLSLEAMGRVFGPASGAPGTESPEARAGLDRMLRTYMPCDHREAVYFRPSQLHRGFAADLNWAEKWLGRYRPAAAAESPEFMLEQSLQAAFGADRAEGASGWQASLQARRARMAAQIIRHIIAYRSADHYPTGLAQRLERELAPGGGEAPAGRPGRSAGAFGPGRSAGAGTIWQLAGHAWTRLNLSLHCLAQRMLPLWYLNSAEKGINREWTSVHIAGDLKNPASPLFQAYQTLSLDPGPETREAFAWAALNEIRRLPRAERLPNLIYFSELLKRLRSVSLQTAAVRASSRPAAGRLPERIVLPAAAGRLPRSFLGWLHDVLGPAYNILQPLEGRPLRRPQRQSRGAA